MGNELEKGIHEINVFKEFCTHIPNCNVSEITKCNPPKPDLSCNFFGKKTYFELARAYSKEFARQMFDPTPDVKTIWGENSVERILKTKLNKRYELDSDLQLLLYDDIGLSLPNDVVIPTIKEILAEAQYVQFEGIWYFAEGEAINVYKLEGSSENV